MAIGGEEKACKREESNERKGMLANSFLGGLGGVVRWRLIWRHSSHRGRRGATGVG